jgi:hypothetical protein
MRVLGLIEAKSDYEPVSERRFQCLVSTIACMIRRPRLLIWMYGQHRSVMRCTSGKLLRRDGLRNFRWNLEFILETYVSTILPD